MASLRTHASIQEPTPVLTLRATPHDFPDNATPEEHAVWLVQQFLGDEASQESVSNNTTTSLNSSVPVFGSTAHRLGMDAEMASMNLEARRRNETGDSRPPTPFPFDISNQVSTSHASDHPNEHRHGRRGRRVRLARVDPNPPPPPSPQSPPQFPTPQELDRLLNEADQDMRRWSAGQLYWPNQEAQDLWSIALAILTIRAKHKRLDELQRPWVTKMRRRLNVEQIEIWWWVRRIKAKQKKEREKDRDKDDKN
ncbi:hypothetical protein GGR53DRAFT_309298 [Hypoxylon sp. FL1150]|nr:hypothetical protein GGR53DRAFT_309298 [Hypoxylon sp. FL1150]